MVGSGPVGLTVAHRLSRLGHDVVLFEAKDKLGGLNEYGLASYKTTNNFAQTEIRWLLSIGGIGNKNQSKLGRDFTSLTCNVIDDAVFLGMGLAGVNARASVSLDVSGIREAVIFIAELRQADR